MGVYTNGLSKIEMGAVAVDGDAGTTLTAIGTTYQDSCKLTQADGTTTEFFIEEAEGAVFSKTKKGSTTLEFQVANPDADTMVKVFGGTAVGTSPAKTWNAPANTINLEQTVKVTTETGMVFVIPRGKVEGKLNASIGRTNLVLLDIKVTALVPAKSGVGAIQVIS